jgi:hypothetical protein
MDDEAFPNRCGWSHALGSGTSGCRRLADRRRISLVVPR